MSGKKSKEKKGKRGEPEVPFELRGLTPFQKRMYSKMVKRWNRSNARHSAHREHRGSRRKP